MRFAFQPWCQADARASQFLVIPVTQFRSLLRDDVLKPEDVLQQLGGWHGRSIYVSFESSL